MTSSELESFISDLLSNSIGQIQAQEEFTKWLGKLNIKQFKAIIDSLYYKEDPFKELDTVIGNLKELPLSKPLTSIIKNFLEVPAKDTLAKIGFQIIEWLYIPSYVMIESKDIEVIKEIYNRSKSNIDDQILEDWLNENKKKTDKWIVLNKILRGMRKKIKYKRNLYLVT